MWLEIGMGSDRVIMSRDNEFLLLYCFDRENQPRRRRETLVFSFAFLCLFLAVSENQNPKLLSF